MRLPFVTALVSMISCCFGTSAQAWYIDYYFSPDSDMYFEDSFTIDPGAAKVTYLHVSDDIGFSAEAGWEYIGATDDGAGGVTVDYDENWGDGDTPHKSAQVTFRILSDFGNTAQTPIDLVLNGEIIVSSYADAVGYGVDANAWTEGIVSNNMGASDIFADNNDTDTVSTTLNLLTNTEYSFEATLEADIWAGLLDLPPDHFDNWTEHDDFFDTEGYRADATANGSAGLFYEISIDGAETPVPEPATMLLFGFGILGLAGLRATKKN